MDGIPWLAPGPQGPYCNGFRANVKAFIRLARCVTLAAWDKADIWMVDLELPGGAAVKLHIYREDLLEAAVCDQCRCMGA